MKLEEITELALTAGQVLLENGAETYRIEETISMICESYGFNGECLAMSNGIVLSIEDSELNKVTSIKKISQKQIDLYRIELVNSFSRQIQIDPLSYEKAKEALETIKQAPNFTLPVRTIAACMTGFTYTLFFNGSLIDGLVSTVVCFFTYLLTEKISQLGFFQFLEYYLAGLTIGSASIFFHTLIPSINAHNVITGSIMILIPGVVLTKGIKDVISGYFSSGISSFCESLIIIAAITTGIGTTLII